MRKFILLFTALVLPCLFAFGQVGLGRVDISKNSTFTSYTTISQNCENLECGGVVASIFDFLQIPKEKSKNPDSVWSKFSSGMVENFTFVVAIATFLFFLDAKLGGTVILSLIASFILLLEFECAYLEGFMGGEAIFMFMVGIIFVLVDFLLVGSLYLGLIGALFVLISIFLSIIPTDIFAEGFSFSTLLDVLTSGLWKVIFAFFIASVLFYIFGRFFKKSPLWKKFVLEGGQNLGDKGIMNKTLLGAKGFVSAELVPNGKVDISGNSYDASSFDSSFIEKGAEIEVVGLKDFQITVKKINK